MTSKVSIQIGRTPNYATVEIGDYSLYFSYKTLVGFNAPDSGIVCISNYWGPTTGKHLNMIQPDKGKRLGRDDFDAAVAKHLPFTF